MGYEHYPWSTPRLPAEGLEQIESVYDTDGTELRRYRIRGTDIIGIEQRMDRTFRIEMIERKPMDIPDGGIFYLDFKYGDAKPEP